MNVTKKIFILITAMLILLPSAVGIIHIFSDHEHAICSNYAEEHFHKEQQECHYDAFRKIPAVEIQILQFETKLVSSYVSHQYNFYQSLSSYNKISSKLRGPPMVARV